MPVNISLNPRGTLIDSRTMAYWAGSFCVAAGIYLDFYPDRMIYPVIYQILFPIISLLIATRVCRFQTQIPLQVIDSINLGLVLFYIGFPLTLTGMLITMSLTMATFRFGSLGFFMVVVPIFLTCLICYYFFPLQLWLYMPLELNIIVIASTLLYMRYLSYVFRKLYLQYIKISDQAKKQEQKYADLADSLAKYLAPQIWESIFHGKQGVRLESRRKRMTIFFSDIAGFTDLSEELEPEALTGVLNTYLDSMSRVALKYGGTIDKFIGDSIMVFFGDPNSRGHQEDALAAVSMAIEMQQEMKLLRMHWAADGIKTPLEIRIGINSGYCTVGNFGTSSRMDYTLLGREVNLASRLEQAASRGEVLISHETWSLVKPYIQCEVMEEIKVKGFFRKVPTYKVLDLYHNLGQKKTYFEHTSKSFSLNLDTTRVDDEGERDKIISVLNEITLQLQDGKQELPSTPQS